MQIDALDEPRLDATAALLASVFEVDAAYRYLFPDAATRTRGLADFFARNLRTHLPYRCTYVATSSAGELLATVTLRPPSGISISTLTMLRRGLLPFAFAHGRAAVQRLFWLKDTYDALEQRVAQSAPHWYVHMMAVRADLQGRGVGSQLLAQVLDRTTGAPFTARRATVLTTHLPQNVVFYRRAQFEVTDEHVLRPPGDREYTVWSMRRQ